MFNTLRIFCAAAALAMAIPALAQTLYRCGSVYQDRPCDGAQQGKVVSNYGGAAPASSGVTDGECQERGQKSLKIVWAREAGASADRQLADARTEADRKLIGSVYRKRGSAPEVRAAIEAECVTEKQEAAQAAALLNAANALKGNQAPPPPALQSSKQAEPQPDQAAAAERKRQEREADARKSRCENIKARQQNILSEQRAGGSVGHMESLNRRRQDIDDEARKAGC
jgi:hypothetical protein